MSRELVWGLCLAAALSAPASLTTLAAGQEAIEPGGEHRPKLWVGDSAPALSVSEWVKGEPVAEFKPGQIYVVEFWATWCGPCIASMPHLSEIQTNLKGKGVTIIGVSSEDPGNPLDAVKAMVKEKGDGMGYTVAYDAGRATYSNWMAPAEQQGIPCSFVVDQKGKLAYIGHPMWLDIPLEGVLAGTWDAKTGMKQIEEAEQMLDAAFSGNPAQRLEAFDRFEGKYPAVAHQSMFRPIRFDLLMQNEKFDRAWVLGGEMVDEGMKKNDAQLLNSIAWMIVDPENDLAERNLPLAFKAARSAVAITEENDASMLDTLARVHWHMGEKSRAVEVQRQAVEKAEGRLKAQLEAVLKEYEEAMKTDG